MSTQLLPTSVEFVTAVGFGTRRQTYNLADSDFTAIFRYFQIEPMLQPLDGSAIFARELIPCVKQWDGTSLLWMMHQGSKKETLKDMKDMKGGNCCSICIDDLSRQETI